MCVWFQGKRKGKPPLVESNKFDTQTHEARDMEVSHSWGLGREGGREGGEGEGAQLSPYQGLFLRLIWAPSPPLPPPQPP